MIIIYKHLSNYALYSLKETLVLYSLKETLVLYSLKETPVQYREINIHSGVYNFQVWCIARTMETKMKMILVSYKDRFWFQSLDIDLLFQKIPAFFLFSTVKLAADP
jgi:hypothetical protein